jgi:hypothetical protein
MRYSFKLRERGEEVLISKRERRINLFPSFYYKIALGDIDREHKPKDVKTIISEMEDKHGEIKTRH